MVIIAVEGIDNAGKTTQCKLLEERLKKLGYSVGNSLDQSTEIFDLIKKFFQQKNFSPTLKTFLFASEIIKQLEILSDKDIAIFDRYTLSLFAYGLMEKLSAIWIKSIVQPLPRADILVYIDIPVELYLIRSKNKSELISPYTVKQLESVKESYDKILSETEYLRIKGSDDKGAISNTIYTYANNALTLLNTRPNS